jgi:hypothetical protein
MMPMPSIRVRRHELELLPDCSRVIIRPFIPTDPGPCSHAIERVLALTELQVSSQLDSLQQEFDGRHHDLEFSWAKHYNRVSHLVETGRPISGKRQLLIGAMFSGEYALECAALFNPSIVPHPDQSDAPAGGIRFILSLRATGRDTSPPSNSAPVKSPRKEQSRWIRLPGSSVYRKLFPTSSTRRNPSA